MTHQKVEIDPRVSKDNNAQSKNTEIDETVIMPNVEVELTQKPELMKVVRVDLLRDSLENEI